MMKTLGNIGEHVDNGGEFPSCTYNRPFYIDTVNPRTTISRALIFGTLIVTVYYTALNAVHLYILPLDVVASSTRITADVAEKLTGFGGSGMLSSIVIFRRLVH